MCVILIQIGAGSKVLNLLIMRVASLIPYMYVQFYIVHTYYVYIHVYSRMKSSGAINNGVK